MSYVRSIPPLLVLLLFPVLVVAIIVVIIWGFFAWIAHGGSGGVVTVFILVLVPLIGGLVYAVNEYRSIPRPSVAGPELRRADAPALWAMVDELAAGVQTRIPDRILVTASIGASVSEIQRERVLFIGLPSFVSFSDVQLRAVLAHELGHFAGGRFALGSFLLRARNGLVAVARNANGVWSFLFRRYASIYIWAEQASAREMEFAADGFAVQLAGSEATASALVTTVESNIAWDAFNEEYAKKYFTLTKKRAPLMEGLQQLLATNAAALAEATQRDIDAEKPSPWDSHPLIRDRIARARQTTVTVPLPPSRPARELLPRDVDRIEAALLVDEQLTSAEWDELAGESRKAFDRNTTLQVIATLTEPLGAATPTPRTVLTALVAHPIQTDPPGLADRAVVFDALQSAGSIRLVHEWNGPGHFVDDAGATVTPSDLLREGTPDTLPTLFAELERRGVDLDRPYELAAVTAEEEPSSEDDLFAALSCTTLGFGMRLRDLLVFGTGVLLSPSHTNGLALMAGGSREDRQVARILARLEEHGLSGLRAEKNAVWIPREELAGVRFRGTNVRLRIAGRKKELRIVSSQYSIRAGDLAAALGAASA